METKSIVEVEESVQDALEALPSILRSKSSTALSPQISEALKVLAPAGYRPVVELQENGRRKRRTASADKWTPETGEILISFTKDAQTHQPPKAVEEPLRSAGLRTQQRAAIRERQKSAAVAEQQVPAPGLRPPHAPTSTHGIAAPVSGQVPRSPQAVSTDLQEQELCKALEEVERLGRAFVALKWFRDEVLPSKSFVWAADAEQRHAVLGGAIEKGLIVTSRIPNPRSPFPTTTLRLNRAKMPDRGEAKRYAPVRIEGEPLSSTILRDRGTY